ncbi:MAG: hypothetical protein WBA74_17525 [Cyclobacteriaceae bacterium]
MPEQENTILEVQSKSVSDDSTPLRDQTVTTVYVRWKPKVLDSRKDEIRATYSDVNGYMYLVSYTVCPSDPNVEIWQVSFNMIIIDPEDQTPDPLGSLPDEEGEMEKPTYLNLCNQ